MDTRLFTDWFGPAERFKERASFLSLYGDFVGIPHETCPGFLGSRRRGLSVSRLIFEETKLPNPRTLVTLKIRQPLHMPYEGYRSQEYHRPDFVVLNAS